MPYINDLVSASLIAQWGAFYIEVLHPVYIHTDGRTDIFLIHFFGLLGPQNVKIRQNLEIDFLLRDNAFLIGKVKRRCGPY